jgi:branched-chain amino acid transport system permease protein
MMWKVLLFLMVMTAALAAPFALYPVFLMECLCYAIFACGFNLLFGYAGLLSFGHAAFFGTGAYLAGYVSKGFGLPPEVSLFAGVIGAAVLSLPFGLLAIRRTGVYFAMITFALGELVYFVALQAPFTGGEDGLQSVPRGALLGMVDLNDERTMYHFVLVVFAFAFFAVARIVRSPFGEVMRAIRENEPRAISLGYNVARYKLMAFTLSSSFSGLAGALKVLTFHFSSLNNVYWHQSGEVVLMTLLGGAGTLVGPVIGAFFVVSLQHFLSEAGDWVTFIIGGTFVICVLSFRKGVVGELAEYFRLRRPKVEARVDRQAEATRTGQQFT